MILATWKNGKEATLYSLCLTTKEDAVGLARNWILLKPVDLDDVFGPATTAATASSITFAVDGLNDSPALCQGSTIYSKESQPGLG